MPAVLAVLAAALCFGTTGTAQALADADASPLSVGAARLAIGGGILGLLGWWHGAKRRRISRDSANTPAALNPRGNLALVVIGALGVFAYQPAFFLGTSLSGVALGTVVGIGSAPVFTGLFESVIRRRPPTRRWCVTTALALIGVFLVSGVVSTDALAEVQPLGIWAALAAGACYATYTLASKRLLERGWGPTETMGALFGVAGIVSIPVLLALGAQWLATPNGLALALWLGIVTVALAYVLFGAGLHRLTATTVATLTLAEPLTATLLGIFVLGERLAPSAVLGLLLLGVALVLLSLPGRRNRVATTS